jgi:hypothetical protein
VRPEYGRSEFGQSCLLARRLVERGFPYVTINYRSWDTHKGHFQAMRRKLPEMDAGMSTLLKELAERGLLDSTIVWWSGELKAVVSGRTAINTTVAVLSELPVRIPAGGTAVVRMGVPAGTAFDQVHLELDEPPDGLVIERESPSRQGTEIVLKCDAAHVAAGLKGNLIVNAFAVKAEEASAAGPQRGRPVPLGMLPAIPFEIVNAD